MGVAIAFLLVLLASAMRFAPHAPNFVPVAAVALFAGAVLPKRISLVVPLAIMLATDAVLGFYQPAVMAAVYGSLVLTALLGWWVRHDGVRPSSVVFGSIAGSLIFFFVTNAAVWWWDGIYSRTLQGLLASYAAGVPFFRNTLAGDLVYNTFTFGLYAIVCQALLVRRMQRDPSLLPE